MYSYREEVVVKDRSKSVFRNRKEHYAYINILGGLCGFSACATFVTAPEHRERLRKSITRH